MVELSEVHRAGTLGVTWTFDTCDNRGVYAYVTGFVIYYCVIAVTSDNRCTGRLIIPCLVMETIVKICV